MWEWSRFDLKDHTFVANMPSDSTEESVFMIAVSKGVAEIRREEVRLFHRPLFGPDVDDVASLSEKVEQIIANMELE